jgi:hypothetical protein
MKKLTAIASILLLPTLIAGIYGSEESGAGRTLAGPVAVSPERGLAWHFVG